MREAREINISLSVLKDCIRGKAQADARKSSQKVPHLPFRQSALTKILKHVFDPASKRECKTVVIACVNPSLADVGASKNTLRFAEMLRLREWIKENSGKPAVLANVLAPRESGAQLLNLTNTEFEYRCQKCPGVRAEQARAFRAKLWQMHIDSQHYSETSKQEVETESAASVESDVSTALDIVVSSRDLDPARSKLPFKERLRPGMVVTYFVSPEELQLAVLLCPAKTISVFQDAFGNVINPGINGRATTNESHLDNTRQYLCALLTPGQTVDSYELNIWTQIVIDVDSMDEEVYLEYDSATRYYYISA
ncbi:hypothetical protein HYALB_00012207 [Hymenoscyphus albidus]|uniref:Kinesin motor domain-containing protein n=1 Tax=Hymenoscyphus albidus TaxID=595503 RepID=A0A9N9LSN9_9HELO|nr:hypothetical protein HYALB_00012207 [Hymenoscyphus albidus]